MSSTSDKELPNLASDHHLPREGQEERTAKRNVNSQDTSFASRVARGTGIYVDTPMLLSDSSMRALRNFTIGRNKTIQSTMATTAIEHQGIGMNDQLFDKEQDSSSEGGAEYFDANTTITAAEEKPSITDNYSKGNEEAIKHSQGGAPTPAEDLADSRRRIESVENKTAKELLDLQRRLQQVESERAEYKRNFEDAQEQIFRMQPRRSDITEDDASKEYNSLCINVEHWIDSHFDQVLDLDYGIYKDSKVDVASGMRLISWIEMTAGGIEALDIPDTLPYYLRNAIMSFITREILQQKPYQADLFPWKLLEIIETSMRTLEPHRDRATVRAWRSETLTALLASTDYGKTRNQRANKMVDHLIQCLQVLLPQASREQLAALQKSALQDLIMPAIKLNEKFNLSAKLFTFSGRGIDGDRARASRELALYDCRNLFENGKAVKTLQPGVECEYVIDICPGLCCRTIKGDSVSGPKTLKKAQILVAVKRPDRPYKLQGETALGHIYRIVLDHKKQIIRG